MTPAASPGARLPDAAGQRQPTRVGCPNCGTVVVEAPDRAAVLTRFPDDVGGSLALLSGGLGFVLCPHCGKPVDTACAHVVALAGTEAIVGIPEGWPGSARAQVLATIGAAMPGAPLHACEGRQAFRTAIMQRGMQPAMTVLRDYALATDSQAWVTANIGRLDGALFNALWLMASGAVQLYTQAADRAQPAQPVFVPNAQAPDEARHVVRNAEAIVHLKRQIGGLLGWLLTFFVSRAMGARSLDPLRTELPALVTPLLLGEEETTAALAEHVGSVSEAMSPDKPGWIVIAYLHEAALALLCRAGKVDNPRRSAWTGWYLFYDASRRRDGNDESVLVPVDDLHATLDEAAFWRRFHERMRATIADEDGSPDDNAATLRALMETAYRAYPDEATRQLEPYVFAGRGPAGSDVDTSLRDATAAPLDALKLRACLARLCQRDEPFAERLLAILDENEDAGAGAADRVQILRCALEALKNVNRIEEAALVAGAGLEWASRRGLFDEEEATEGAPPAVPPHALSGFLNELANVMRLLRRLDDALLFYNQARLLNGGDVEDADHRVIVRNEAIVMRELHRYREAALLLESLLPHAGTLELRGLVTSLALCRVEMGEGDEALALMRRHLDRVEGATSRDAGVLEFCTLYCSLLADAGELDEAARLFAPFVPIAPERGHHAAMLLDRDLALRRATALDEMRGVIDEQVHVLRRVIGQPMGALGQQAIGHVVDALVGLDEPDRAEDLLRELARSAVPALFPRGWQLRARAAVLARRRGDEEQAADDLEAALAYFQEGVGVVVASGDLQRFAAPDRGALDRLVDNAVRVATHDPDRDQRRWRSAADALAAPALSAQLRRSAGLSPALEDPRELDDRLLDWLRSSGSAVVQACTLAGSVRLLRTTLEDGGRLHTRLLDLSLPVEDATRLAGKLAFRLRHADPAGAALPLHRVPELVPVAEALQAGLAGLPDDRPLLVIPGPLQEAVWVLAAGDRLPLCFAPSLVAAMALHAREAGAEGRPRRLFGFATWFDRELASPAAALAQVPARVRALAAAHGLASRDASGGEATRAALLDGLAAADVAWIACHGRVRREGESVDLIVAADGHLPPAELRDAALHLRDAHVVAWEDIAALPQTPRVVFSSACNSGMTHTNTAGERIGLERALLPAGTAQFVAPLWPVPTVAVQQVVAGLVDRWLGAPEVPLAVHLLRHRQWCAREGVAPLANQALALFGLSSHSLKA